MSLDTGICRQCEKPFEYERKAGTRRTVRQVCDPCGKENARRAVKKCKARLRVTTAEAPHGRTAPAEMPAQHAARLEGISESRAVEITRQALTKIRNHPELKRLFARWLEDGSPVPKAQRDPGEMLLDWELEMAEWYALEARLKSEGMMEEAAECVEEIKKFADTLRSGLLKIIDGK